MASQSEQNCRQHRLARGGALLSAAARMWRERRAVALIEFAIVLPVLVVLLLPLADLGMAFYVKTQVMTAAEAGAQYAFVHGWSGNNSATQTSITTAVTNATSLSGLTAAPAPSLACGCTDGTTVTYSSPTGSFTESSCSALAACSSGASPGAYVTVNAQSTYRPLFTYLIFGSSSTLSATSTVRVQ